MCLIASLDFIGGDQSKVTKHVTFHTGHEDTDKAYCWGLRWSAGTK